MACLAISALSPPLCHHWWCEPAILMCLSVSPMVWICAAECALQGFGLPPPCLSLQEVQMRVLFHPCWAPYPRHSSLPKAIVPPLRKPKGKVGGSFAKCKREISPWYFCIHVAIGQVCWGSRYVSTQAGHNWKREKQKKTNFFVDRNICSHKSGAWNLQTHPFFFWGLASGSF